jgi:hypothetical protein
MVLSGELEGNPRLCIGKREWREGVIAAGELYVLQQTTARRQKMDAVNDRQGNASLLSGHQDLIPNSDATRLRLDSPDTVIPTTNPATGCSVTRISLASSSCFTHPGCPTSVSCFWQF